MIDHPAAHLFALVVGVLPGGLILWALDVTSWISWITLVLTCLFFAPGVGIFVQGRWRKSSGGVRAVLMCVIPALMAAAVAGAIAWLGGTGADPDHGLHWAWMWLLFLPGAMFVGMAGIFAGAAYGSS